MWQGGSAYHWSCRVTGCLRVIFFGLPAFGSLLGVKKGPLPGTLAIQHMLLPPPDSEL